MKVIKITALWCMSCLVVNAHFDKIKMDAYDCELQNWDYDSDGESFQQYAIGTTLPVILIEDAQGQVVARSVGEVSRKELQKFLDHHLPRK